MAVTFSSAEALALGQKMHHQGDLGGAEWIYTRIVQCEPDNADAHHLLGVIALQVEKWDIAAEKIETALSLRGDDASFLSHHGAALNGLKRHSEAEAQCRKAIAIDPSFGAVWINLGNALRNQVRVEEACDAYAEGLRLLPDHAECRANYALMLRASGRWAEWRREIARAAKDNPSNVDTVLLHAESLLESGEYDKGWSLYECRYDLPRTKVLKRTFVDAPQWSGEDIRGKTILIHDEQGFGDTLEFIRYLPLVKARGARVIFQVIKDLKGIASRVPGWDVLITREEQPSEPIHVQCPLLSLPRAFKTRLDTIPATIPYLTPRRDLVGRWGKIIRRKAGTTKAVGLVWGGRRDFHGDTWRSPGLAQTLPLMQVPNVTVFGLQKGDARADLDGLTLPASFIDLGPEIKDFEDTAAIMASLDLVISSCTAPAHLAGGLGVPLWMMLSATADWRWLQGRTDSPWYPNARLFRQPRLGDWGAVMDAVTEALIDK
ncbi:hypothetical protein WV31_04990 [Magnetospirillum sp. ME-1]|uniref:tetratricopeptide repeat-containing glycosyltransferase family protein n=1 Tax=Magnetospirillum sp. ME-1 TaxID=1639348 RepID=UPI000A17B114|nr:tetratricopeptide repeat-containing glycosyltransferase family protein [Magnetospirillum sp. ME-1]ARJ65061.1 hypothetical protein WV31_04990 [Magnetospirillum sp. ME-1]